MTKILTFVELDTPAFEVTSPMGADVTWRFAEPTDYLPGDIDCIPSIASVRYDAATISLGENLGQRASLTVSFWIIATSWTARRSTAARSAASSGLATVRSFAAVPSG